MRFTRQQKKHWEEKGYLVLSSFFTPAEIEPMNALVDRLLVNPSVYENATVNVLHGRYVGQRFRISEAPPEIFQGPVKIKDLFLDEQVVRNLALNKRLTQVLAQLLEGPPLVCNSLNFLWGSQQPDHIDTWYMPSPFAHKSKRFLSFRREPDPRQDRLAVSSICLEDVHPGAGPLIYYPASHRLPPYRFAHGGIHAVNEEMPACLAYVEKQIKDAGIIKEQFLGKAGDVFLWHGQLLHGGAQIKDSGRTRKTLVTHYWRAQDVVPDRAIRVHKTGFYEKRAHQPVVRPEVSAPR